MNESITTHTALPRELLQEIAIIIGNGNINDQNKSYQCSQKIIYFHSDELISDEQKAYAEKYVAEMLFNKTVKPAEIKSSQDLGLQLTEKGKIKTTPNNLKLILDKNPMFEGRIKFNELDQNIYLNGKPITDVDFTNIRTHIDDKLKVVFSNNDIFAATVQVAHLHKYHPVREYLSSLKWDGNDRIEQLANILDVEYADADHQELVLKMLKCFLVSCVARAFQPGCKVDTMLVLKGETGCRKSTFLKALAVKDDWFSDQAINIENKDGQQTIQGKWIMEFAEFQGMNKKEANAIKDFLSRQWDDFRKSYGKVNEKYPRQVVFTGSINDDEFLDDPTSNRRFWVITVGNINIDQFLVIRDQLWAQAVEAYKAKTDWFLNREDEQSMSEYVADYNKEDVWTDKIRIWIDDNNPEHIITSDLLFQILCISHDRQSMKESHRLGKILKYLGWSKKNKMIDGLQKKVWVKDGKRNTNL